MRTRSIRFRGKRKGGGPVLDLDITSLLDILVIMLVFLIKSYDSSGIVPNIPKNIELPPSNSTNINTSGVNVQVSKDSIHVDDKEVYREETASQKLGSMRTIYPLYDELVRKKEMVKQIRKTTPEAKKFSGMINIVMDKSIRYSIMKKVMHTCAQAGFKTFKFVVLSEES